MVPRPPMRPILLLLAIVSILAVPAVSGATPGGVTRDLGDLRYARGLETEVLEADTAGLTFVLTNTNEGRPTPSQERVIHSEWVAAKPGVRVAFEVTDIAWRIEWQDEVEGGLGPDGVSSAGPVPASFTRPQTRLSDDFRGVAMHQFRLSVTSPVTSRDRPGDRGVAVLERAVVRADFSSPLPEEPAIDLGERDPFLLQMMDLAVLNSAQAPLAYERQDRLPATESVEQWSRLLGSATAGGPVVRGKAIHPGLYRFDAPEAARMGVRPTAWRPREMRVLLRDRPLPLLLRDDREGLLDSRGSLFFYVPASPRPSDHFQPVWLLQGEADDPVLPPVQRMAVAPATSETPPSYRLEATVRAFEPNHYIRGASTLQTGKWASVGANRGETARLTFRLSGVLPSASGSLDTWVGAEMPQQSLVVQTFVNGVEVQQQARFTGRGAFRIETRIPPGVLRDGENELALYYPHNREDRASSSIYVHYADITYPVDPERFPLNQEVTAVPATGDGTASQIRHLEPGRDDGAAILLDVTEPFAPVEVPSRRQLRGAMTETIAALPGGESQRRLFLATTNATRFLSDPRVVDGIELLDNSAPADLLIVAHRDNIRGIEPFAEWRRSQGLDVRLVDIETVYDEFSFGSARSDGVSRLVRWAFRYWPGRRLSQVILVGEASDYWWPLEFPRDDVSPSQVPVFDGHDPNMSIRGDEGYGHVSGTGDLLDVVVARVSARTHAEAAAYFDRVRQYETAPPAGPWQTRHVFVTDDEPEFARVAERIIGSELQEAHVPERYYLQEFPYEDYFRIIQRKRSYAMTDAIVRALSRGSLTTTYLGHGGPNLWSSERIFHYRDITQLDTGGRRPIMAAASCDTAWIDYPVDPVRQSLGEQFLLSPNGGAIAIFAPVAGTSSFEHDFLIRAFYRALGDERVETLAPATLYAKFMYMLERNQAYVANQFIVMGDPSLRIPRSTSRLAVEISPGSAFTSEEATFAIRGRAPEMPWGRASAVLLNEYGDTVAGPGHAIVRNGQFDISLPMPPYASPGRHRIVVEAFNSEEDSFEAISTDVEIREPRVAVAWRSDPPAASRIAAGQQVSVTLSAENQSEEFIGNLRLVLRNATTGEELTETTVSLAAGSPREWTFPIPAPAGVTVLEADVYHAGETADRNPLASAALELRALAPGLPPVSVPSGLAMARRFSTPEETLVTVPVYNLLDEDLRQVEASLLLLDSEEGTPVGRTLRADLLAARGKALFEFREPSLFPAERLPFRVEVAGTGAGSGERATHSIDLRIDIPVGDDVEVLPGSVHTERKEYVEGQTVYVRARVRNNSDRPVEGLRTGLYVNFPWLDDALAESAVDQAEVVFQDPLAPGEARDVRLRWDPPQGNGREVRLYVVANSDNRLLEVDYRNNVGDVLVNMRRLPNLALDLERSGVSQEFILPGDVVGVTAAYLNDSPFDFAHPFVVEVRAHGDGVPAETIYRAGYDYLDSGAEGLLQTSWRADGIRDRIVISVNEDREFGESSAADNSKTVPLMYTFPRAFLDEHANGGISFAHTIRSGKMQDVTFGPRGALQLSAIPQRRRTITFSNEFVQGDPLPGVAPGGEYDNRMMLADGGIAWSPFEMPEPVHLRVPMPADDRTTMYDVYVHQLGQNRPDNKASNYYRYRMEDETGWTPVQERDLREAFLGRVDTRDNVLDISFAPDDRPSWNLVLALHVHALQGTYTSPVYEPGGLDPSVLVLESETPGATRIVFELRTGDGDRFDPAFGEWVEYVPGDALPHGGGVRMLQWRATLVGDRDLVPYLFDVRFDPRAGALPAPEVASVQ